MKTTISMDSIRSSRDQARKLEAEAREIRYKANQAREALKQEEETILQGMVDTVRDAGVFMTAREIVTAIGGTMSIHEVAGQLTYARNSRDSLRKPQPYFDPARNAYKMKHEAMSKAAPSVEVEERRVTRRFAEVDESGKPIPGGRSFKQTETRNIYKIER